MTKLGPLALLFAGIAIGAIAAGALESSPVFAQGAADGPWRVSAVPGGPSPAAWRINSRTGHMELCFGYGAGPGDRYCNSVPDPK
jgi:hypothetical protein